MTRQIDRCPCCGGPLLPHVTPREHLAQEAPGWLQSRLVERLARRPGRWLTTQELVGHVYADDPEGGALTAANTLSVSLGRMRPWLTAHGWTIQASRHGRGGSKFRLVMLPAIGLEEQPRADPHRHGAAGPRG